MTNEEKLRALEQLPSCPSKSRGSYYDDYYEGWSDLWNKVQAILENDDE